MLTQFLRYLWRPRTREQLWAVGILARKGNQKTATFKLIVGWARAASKAEAEEVSREQAVAKLREVVGDGWEVVLVDALVIGE